MYISLIDAPVGIPLHLARVTDAHLAAELTHIGVFEGSEFVRLDEEVVMQPLKIKSPRGEVVLCCGMASKIVVHFEDGRKLPLVEMQPSQHGHLEGTTGGPEFTHALKVLGLRRNDEIRLIRKLPPMEYLTVIEKKKRIHLTEGMAAKIWGAIDNAEMQFVAAQTGKNFHVKDLLGGENARRILHGCGIDIGTVLVLKEVAQAQSVIMNHTHPVIISTHDGLRMFFHENQAQHIYVNVRSDL